jgi:uncharacterized protein (DUF58 family)
VGVAETEPGDELELTVAAPGSTAWPAGPPSATVAELVRTLEVTITRRLDGVLHGNHQGITPGHGSEPGEARVYQPGDDVRRIDWNVTARTRETHVRDQIADRDLEAWVVVDTSAAMQFGTQRTDKAQLALGATAAVGFLTARNQNRLGAVLVAGPELRVVPPRAGGLQVRAILSAVASPPPSEGRGRAALATAIERVGKVSRRRGFVAVISDFGGDDWADPLARLGMRHDLLAVTITDPRERDVPPVGLVEFVDPSTGSAREVRVTADVQRQFVELAERKRTERIDALRRAGAEVVELTTDADWFGAIVRHVRRRRMQAVRGGAIRR